MYRNTEATFLELHFSISKRFVSSKLFDKRNGFDFGGGGDYIFQFLDSDVPLMGLTFLNIFGLLERLFVWATSMAAIENQLTNFSTKVSDKTSKSFFKIHRWLCELVSKFRIALTPFQHDLSKPEIFGKKTVLCVLFFWRSVYVMLSVFQIPSSCF